MPLPRWLAKVNRRFTNRILRHLVGRVPPFAEVTHRGRRTGKTYQTVVLAFPLHGGLSIPLTYSSRSDWVRNVLASGEAVVRHSGGTHLMGDPRVLDGEEAWHATPPVARYPLMLIRAPEVLRLHRAEEP